MNQEGKVFNICLLGASLDVGNMGVRALAVSLIKVIVDCKPNARISLLYGNRSSGAKELYVSGRSVRVHVVNYRWSPKARLQEHILWILFTACIHRAIPNQYTRKLICRSTPWLKALTEADFVGDIRGGDSFSDIYGFWRFLLGSIPRIIAILMQTELVLLPQTYGPFKSRFSRRLASWIMARCTRLYSRDIRGLEVIRNSLGDRASAMVIRYCPDVAFAMEAAQPEQLAVEPALDSTEEFTLVGLNVSGLLYMGGYTRDNMFGLKCDYRKFVHELVRHLMKEPNIHVLIVPHVLGLDENESAACREVWQLRTDQYRERVHLVTGAYDQSETKAIIGLCDFFVGSRMHACIAALSQGIPTVGIAYSRKFRGVFNSIGLGNMVLDARELNSEELLSAYVTCFKNREIVAKHLRKEVLRVQTEITATFRLGLLAGNNLQTDYR